MKTLRFESDHIEVFKKTSSDCNPLHADKQYASKTPFGEPVVYGISTVLMALGQWSQGRGFELSDLEVAFIKPLYLNTNYQMEVSEENQDRFVRINLTKGRVIYCVIRFHWRPLNEGHKNNIFKTLDIINNNIIPEMAPKSDLGYHINVQHDFEGLFSLRSSQMPNFQLTFLCWASYFVGMVSPGRQALFSELKIKFKPFLESQTHRAEVVFTAVRKDERFRLLTMDGAGDFVEKFTLKAFARPDPCRYSIEDIKRLTGRTKNLKGEIVVIAGASRGFGSVLAKVLALHGANLILTYRTNQREMEGVVKELDSCTGAVRAMQVDYLSKDSVESFKTQLGEYAESIDWFICNASSPIRARTIKEFSPEEFEEEFIKFYRIGLNSVMIGMDFLRHDGVLVNISSLYASKPEKGFAHYLSAKIGIESLLESLSLEDKTKTYLNVRLPMMQTDQTNVHFQLKKPENPIAIAQMVADKIVEIRRRGGYHFAEITNDPPGLLA